MKPSSTQTNLKTMLTSRSNTELRRLQFVPLASRRYQNQSVVIQNSSKIQSGCIVQSSSTTLPPLQSLQYSPRNLDRDNTSLRELACNLRFELAKVYQMRHMVDDLARICASHEQRLLQLGDTTRSMAADWTAYERLLW